MSIEARNITRKFGSFIALNNVSLKVETGELVALLGPSGSGKTTLLRIIAGLDQADTGRIYFHGDDATSWPIGARKAGFVFQHYALFRHMTVAKNIAFGLRMRPSRERPSKQAIAEKVHELLRLVQIENFGDRFPSQLSGGQRQRVALARALAIEPRVLLLDEPFGALDARVRKDLRKWLRQLQDDLQITTIFVTHDQEEALEISDRVVVMNNALIEQVGTPEEVYDHPATPFVFKFLGNVNAVHERTANQAVEPVPGKCEVTFVRPHDVEVLRQRNGSPVLEATVEHTNTAGSVARLDLRLRGSGERLEVELPRARHSELDLKPGDEAFVKFHKVRTFPTADALKETVHTS
ncbi:MAG: sulfate ABC transporter ATP-binding protein [Acidobacteriaceae bacterium]|nr:sulfate ABC transporter ATP-binding protein [Acidobacteriaceae bacterium]